MSQDSAPICLQAAIVLKMQMAHHVCVYLSSHSPYCREERSSSSEGQIRFLVYTLELASQRADSLGEKLTLALSQMQREERGYSASNDPVHRLTNLSGSTSVIPASAPLLAGKGKLTWLIDMDGYSMRNAPSLRVSPIAHPLQQCILVLQSSACILHSELSCLRRESAYLESWHSKSFPANPHLFCHQILPGLSTDALSISGLVQVSMQTLNILQSHYPERLGMAICYHAPRLFSFSWKVLPTQLPCTVMAPVAIVLSERRQSL